jgi:two-component system, OmpR family, sensor kinase
MRMDSFVVSCTRDGAVAEVLRDDLAIAPPAGAPLERIFDHGSAEKARTFLDTVREQCCAAGWQLNVVLPSGVRALDFAGVATRDALLVLATTPPRSGARDHELYEELSRLNNELINRERELARKSAALERLAAEKNRLVAIAAHDLRNPLTVIASYADLMQMEGIAAQQAPYVEEIARSAKFMRELVEEMLDGARIESGVVTLNLQELDLVGAARHASVINRMRADAKEIALAFESAVERLPVRADPVKLRQIINNLVVNAIKFSAPHTTVTIRVSAADASAVLEIEDQGIGIAAEKIPTIFEPFATLGRSGTAGETSTGLGLAIVHQLVALHHGRISVMSEVGKGSVFRVELPRNK